MQWKFLVTKQVTGDRTGGSGHQAEVSGSQMEVEAPLTDDAANISILYIRQTGQYFWRLLAKPGVQHLRR